jgi:uncharacterized pyridoxamine 5'-phosphate oxidase family protein
LLILTDFVSFQGTLTTNTRRMYNQVIPLGTIHLLGLDHKPNNVMVNGQAATYEYITNEKRVIIKIQRDIDLGKTLNVKWN